MGARRRVAGGGISAAGFILPGVRCPVTRYGDPGFLGGTLFSIVLGIAARRRRFDELSLPRFATWGAAGGLLLSFLPAALVAVGLASIGGPEVDLWEITAAIAGPLILLSAA